MRRSNTLSLGMLAVAMCLGLAAQGADATLRGKAILMERFDTALATTNRFAAQHLLAAFEKLVPGDPSLKEMKSRAEALRTMSQMSLALGNGVAIEFVLISPGFFTMGSDRYYPEERPVHKVTLTKPYYMGKFEVTQEQWLAAMGEKATAHEGAKLPVAMVSWNDCRKFMARMNEKFDEFVFDLPTEAQWEFACRAGTTTDFCFGNNPTDLADYAWYDQNSGKQTRPVGTKRANAWGLYDTHGNVWEWCRDWWAMEYPTDEIDPTGTASGRARAIRGGSFLNIPRHMRSSNRHKFAPVARLQHVGFRCAIVGVKAAVVVGEAPGEKPAP